MSISSRVVGLMMLIGAVILGLLALNLALNPGPIGIDVTEGNARVVFSADRRLINKYGDCVEVRWDSENIKTIYFDNSPTVGTGTGTVCIERNVAPSLRVTFADDTTREYKLGISTIAGEPLIWVLGGVALLVFVLGGFLLVSSFVSGAVLRGRAVIRSAARGLALVIFSVLLTLSILELGLRFYFNTFGSEADRVAYTYNATEIQEKAARFAGLPYVQYGPSPYYPGHNTLGYRGEPFTIAKPAGTFRIATLGASTTYGFGVEPDEAYPAQLQKILREEYGATQVEVINAGAMGYTSWETLSNFMFRVLDLQPDLVIFYGATNDVEVRAQSPACYSGETPLHGLNTFHGLWKTTYEGISPFTLQRFLSINLGLQESPNALEFSFAPTIMQKDCQEDPPIPAEEAIQQNPPVYFERNLHSLIALAQANDIEVLISRFIYPTTDIVNFALPDYWLAAIEEHNTILEQLSQTMNVPYYDLKADYVSVAEDWWSGVHMTAQGTHQQASLYAAFLVDQGLVPVGE